MGTVGPVMTKSVARGDATAARPSSGPAVSCVHRADMGPSAKVWGAQGGCVVPLCRGVCRMEGDRCWVSTRICAERLHHAGDVQGSLQSRWCSGCGF